MSQNWSNQQNSHGQHGAHPNARPPQTPPYQSPQSAQTQSEYQQRQGYNQTLQGVYPPQSPPQRAYPPQPPAQGVYPPPQRAYPPQYSYPPLPSDPPQSQSDYPQQVAQQGMYPSPADYSQAQSAYRQQPLQPSYARGQTVAGDWLSKSIRYDDPASTLVRMKYRGVFQVQIVEPSLLHTSVEELLADKVAMVGADLISDIYVLSLVQERQNINIKLYNVLAPVLLMHGVELVSIHIVDEIHNPPGFFLSFFQKAGPVVILAGLASIVLALIGYNLKYLLWIDMWGEVLGWLIRGGIVAGGVAMYALGQTLDTEE